MDLSTELLSFPQLALIPRIEVTPIFSGGTPGEHRLREYTRLGCNQTYYEVNYESNLPDQCKELLHSVNIWLFDGAEGNRTRLSN